MSDSRTAFTPYDMAGHHLRNRIAMAPMTRTRSPGTVPNEHVAEYYRQRASAAFIITEGIHPTPEGQGYPDTPGLWSPEQIAAWKTVTAAVHGEGGLIFAQLMHVGRIGNEAALPDGMRLLAPSAVTSAGKIYTHEGPKDYTEPKAMTVEEIHQVIEGFAQASRNAIAAGFDGVEIHGANGYLVHQFISSNANLRTDEWGGSVAGHIKFAVEVSRACAAAIGSHNVGIRVSPAPLIHDLTEDTREETYLALVDELAKLDLAYLHLNENPGQRELAEQIAARWPGTLVLNADTVPRPTTEEELPLLDAKVGPDQVRFCDVLTYGAAFIANPDLPHRLEAGIELTRGDNTTFYGIGPEGYIDYATA
jgi:N-ethylmaleimide reductase